MWVVPETIVSIVGTPLFPDARIDGPFVANNILCDSLLFVTHWHLVPLQVLVCCGDDCSVGEYLGIAVVTGILSEGYTG